MKIELQDGKYTIIFEEKTGKFYALRYGKEWFSLTGYGLILAMAQKIESLQEQIDVLKTFRDSNKKLKIMTKQIEVKI